MTINIDALIDSYDVQDDKVLLKEWAPIEEKLWQQIENYGAGDNDYGAVLSKHLIRTSAIGMAFITDCLGFSARAGRNFYDANLLQDLGKTHPNYKINIWSLPHRPSEEERAEKRLHTARGAEIIDQALQGASNDLKNHPHIQVIKAIQLYHHEKSDDRLGQIIKAICIIDAYDGDMIHRPHQRGSRSPAEALKRLKTAPKYNGAFDSEMLKRFIDFQLKAG